MSARPFRMKMSTRITMIVGGRRALEVVLRALRPVEDLDAAGR